MRGFRNFVIILGRRSVATIPSLFFLSAVLVGSGCSSLGQGSTSGGGNPPPLAISNVTATNATVTSATVAWQTNVSSNSQVEYGLSSSYGSFTALDPTMVTSHQQALSSLKPATLYHCRVHSIDANNGPAVSGDLTFTTAADTTPPTVSITAPAANATLSGTVSLVASAADDVAVASVQFKVDNANTGAAITAAPYSFLLNTTTLLDGNHIITAVATDTSGNTATSVAVAVKVNNAVPAPSIASLNPVTGPVGTSVTVTGANFGATKGTSTITFNGTAATPTSWTTTNIVVPVPAGATTGNVVVTVGGVASNGVLFTVTTAAVPTITSLNPTSGLAGASVTISGTNFGALQGTSTVTFNGTSASPTSWSATSIVAPVPTGAATGPVVVTVGGAASNGLGFTVTTTSGPTITNLNPAFGPVGASVTIIGTNFGASQGTSTVTFNGTATTPASWSATSIVAPVPTGATTGNVVVTVGGVASNSVPFTVPSGSITFPIKLSANKRYFVDQNSTPWLMVADAAHHMMPAMPQSSLAQYLNDRVANGFNTINMYGMCAGSGTCPTNGAANDGTLPFIIGTDSATWDISSYNPPYWAEVDNVITQAANRGLVVLIDPIPWGVDFGTAMENIVGPINYPTKDFNFGVFLGMRYKNSPNIIWQFGQDFRHGTLPDATFMDYMAQVMAGVASVDQNHLITCQLNYYRSYSQQGIPIGNTSYNSTLDTSFAYSYYETYDYVLAAYNASPVMPVFLGEANYETANNTGLLSSNANAFITRLQMWWTMTSGGAGHEFGNAHVNHFDSASSPTWQSQLDTTATTQVKYLANLFKQIQWWTLVPEVNHQMVTAGYGTYSTTNENLYSATYATTAWNPTLAIVYTPVSTTLTVKMTNFSKSMTVSWYDPTTGNSTSIGSFSNSGFQMFTTPANAHSDGTHDWVLVLQ